MTYTGEDCSASQNKQGERGDNWSCEGDPGSSEIVRVMVTDRPDPSDPTAMVWFDGNVSLDESFRVDAWDLGTADLGPQTFVHIFGSGRETTPSQTVAFDTSCSRALGPGDQFGGILIETIELND